MKTLMAVALAVVAVSVLSCGVSFAIDGGKLVAKERIESISGMSVKQAVKSDKVKAELISEKNRGLTPPSIVVAKPPVKEPGEKIVGRKPYGGDVRVPIKEMLPPKEAPKYQKKPDQKTDKVTYPDGYPKDFQVSRAPIVEREDGRITSLTVFADDGKSSDEFTFDKTGRIVSHVHYGGDTNHDKDWYVPLVKREDGRILSLTIFGDDGKPADEYNFDEMGRIVSHLHYNSVGSSIVVTSTVKEITDETANPAPPIITSPDGQNNIARPDSREPVRHRIPGLGNGATLRGIAEVITKRIGDDESILQ